MKNTLVKRVLALVLTICMILGMFVTTIGAAEEAPETFTVSATSAVTAAVNGHYPVEFHLMNPTETDYSITLKQTAGDAVLTYRGTTAENGVITVGAKTDNLVSGYLTFSDAENQNKTDVTVEVRSGTEVLDTLTIDVTDGSSAEAGSIRATTFSFADGAQNWNGTADSGALKVAANKEAAYGSKLKLVPGNLYRLTFKAKAATAGKEIYAKAADFDADGKALTTPMSLYSRTQLTNTYAAYEYRFVANTSGDAKYAATVLSFVAGTSDVWVDDVTLVDCGEASANEMPNADFETYTGAAVSPYSGWFTHLYTGGQRDGYVGKAMEMHDYSNEAPPHGGANWTNSRFGPDGAQMAKGEDDFTFNIWMKANDYSAAKPAYVNFYVMGAGADLLETYTFDLSENWENYTFTFQKTAAMKQKYGFYQVRYNVFDTRFATARLDHSSLRLTQAATNVTAEQIAAAAPIAEIRPLGARPAIAAPVVAKFYRGTVTPVHGSLDIKNLEVAYDNGYEISLFTMDKPADLPANAAPTVTYNGTTTAYANGTTYKVPANVTSGTFAFNWAEKSVQKVHFTVSGTTLLAANAEQIAAARELDGSIKLTADLDVTDTLDLTGVNMNGHKVNLSETASVTGVSTANVVAPKGYYAVENDGVVTVEKVPEEADGTITNTGRSLNLEGAVHINQYVKISGFPNVDVAENGGLLVFKSPVDANEATYENADEVHIGLIKTGSEYMQRTDGIAAKEYADEVYLRVYVIDQYGRYTYSPVMKYSVQEYCEGRLAKSTNEDMKNLCAAMLHYGTAAQLYFDYNTDDLANENIRISWPVENLDKSLLTPLKSFTTSVTATGDVKDTGKTLTLEGAIKVNFYFHPVGWKASKAELLVWDGVSGNLSLNNVSYTVQMKKDGSDWMGSSREFVAKEMGKTIFAAAKMTDTNGGVHYSDVIAYSPEAYAEGRINNSTNENMVKLAEKMVIYGEYAAIYFGVSENKPSQPEEEPKPVDPPSIAIPDDAPYGEYMVYEGLPQAHIMLPENATELEQYAAEELRDHVELVTGATLPINYVDPAERSFTAVAEPSVVYVPEQGYYPVEFTMKNPTDDLLNITLRQKADTEKEPKLTIRGDNGLDGVITMQPYSQIAVSGQFTVEDATAYPRSTVEVEVVANGTVIATMPIEFSAMLSMIDGSFENGTADWQAATLDAEESSEGTASLKVDGGTAADSKELRTISGHLYYLGFWAKTDASGSKLHVRINDYAADGGALAVPMSLYSGASIRGSGWMYYEYRFVANTYDDVAYAYSKLNLEAESAGSIWVDDLLLVDCGEAIEDPIINGDFENVDPDTGLVTNWWFNNLSIVAEDEYYTGSRSATFVPSGQRLAYAGLNMQEHDTTYSISFWAKAKTETASLTFDWMLLLNGVTHTSGAMKPIQLSQEWERYEVILNVPYVEPGVKLNGVYIGWVYSGEFWIDHYEIHQIDNAVALVDSLELGKVEPIRTYKTDFETGADGWNGTLDTTAGHESTASLKVSGSAQLSEELELRSAYLYRLGFWAKADAADTTFFTKVNDFGKNGSALSAPMTVYNQETVGTDWTYFEYRFAGNASMDSTYAMSKLGFETTGTIHIDDVLLVDCGVAPENELPNYDFETYTGEAVSPYTGWYTHLYSGAQKDGYSGKAMEMHDYSNDGSVHGGDNWKNSKFGPNSVQLVKGMDDLTFSIWMKAEDYSAAKPAYVKFYVMGNGLDVLETYTYDLSSDWQRYEFTFEKTEEMNTQYSFYQVLYNIFDTKFASARLDLAYAMNTQAATDLTEDDLVADNGEVPEIPAPEVTMPIEPAVPVPTPNSLTLFIATPESYPALETAFSEDLEWIGDTDGFAIRRRGGVIYIFGNEVRGALNGVYDFIEENLGVVWFRAHDTAYDPMSTVKPDVIDYREKSPFKIRGMHTRGVGQKGEQMDDWATDVVFSRNKLNSKPALTQNWQQHESWRTIGLSPDAPLDHNIGELVTNSPIYDPTCYEYWNTDENGNYITEDFANTIKYQVNPFSKKTEDAIVANVLAQMKGGKLSVAIGQHDVGSFIQLPYTELPYEYEPGKFVYPEDENYLSTIWWDFLTRIADRVAEVYPDRFMTASAYQFTEPVPACRVSDNLRIVFAPIGENLREPYYVNDPEDPNYEIYQNLLGWSERTKNMFFYNYYFTYMADNWFERPIGERMQKDMQMYAEMGFLGANPEGEVDNGPEAQNWDMSHLTYWLYGKLTWNPYEDVDALTEYYCTKVYGPAAAPYILEYYGYIKDAWNENHAIIHIDTTTQEYLEWFILNSGYVLQMAEALENATKSAKGVYADRLKYMVDTFNGVVMASSNLKIENVSALYTTAGKEAILAQPDFTSDIWKDTQKLENFYDNKSLKFIDGNDTNVYLLWDEDYLYVGYEMYHGDIANIKTSNTWDSAKTWWGGKSDDVETFVTVDPSKESYYFYSSNPSDLYIRWKFENGYRRHDPTICDWTYSDYFFDEEGTENDKWVVIQALSFDSMDLQGPASTSTELFAYFYHEHYSPEGDMQSIAWNGATVWAPKFLRQIEMRTEPYVAPEAPDVDTDPDDPGFILPD